MIEVFLGDIGDLFLTITINRQGGDASGLSDCNPFRLLCSDTNFIKMYFSISFCKQFEQSLTLHRSRGLKEQDYR
jgi:hypothetical protein